MNVKKIDEIVFNVTSNKPLVRTSNGVGYYVDNRQRVTFDFSDIRETFKIERNIDGDIEFESLPMRIELKENTALLRFNFSEINFSAGQTIILDPTISVTNSTSVDVGLAYLDNRTFVVAWIDSLNIDAAFSVYDTNGTVLVNRTVVDNAAGGNSRISVAAINSTNFIVSWFDEANQDFEYSVWTRANVSVVATTAIDQTIGAVSDTSVITEKDRARLCYIEDSASDASFSTVVYGIWGAGTVTDIDISMSPEDNLQQLIDCTSINETRFAYAYFDDSGNDITLDIMDGTTPIVNNLFIAENVGERGQVDITSINKTKVAIAWHGSIPNSINLSIWNVATNSSLMNNILVDSNASNNSIVSTATIQNSSEPEEWFIVAWNDRDAGNINSSMYNASGTLIRNFVLADDESNTNLLFDIWGNGNLDNSTNGPTIRGCDNTFLFAYFDSNEDVIVKTMLINGSVWNGVCPVVFEAGAGGQQNFTTSIVQPINMNQISLRAGSIIRTNSGINILNSILSTVKNVFRISIINNIINSVSARAGKLNRENTVNNRINSILIQTGKFIRINIANNIIQGILPKISNLFSIDLIANNKITAILSNAINVFRNFAVNNKIISIIDTTLFAKRNLIQNSFLFANTDQKLIRIRSAEGFLNINNIFNTNIMRNRNLIGSLSINSVINVNSIFFRVNSALFRIFSRSPTETIIAAGPAAQVTGAGAGGGSNIYLYKADLFYDKEIHINKNYIIEVRTYDINNKSIDVDTIDINTNTSNISISIQNIIKLSDGRYQRTFKLLESNYSNITFNIRAKQNIKFIDRNITVEVIYPSAFALQFSVENIQNTIENVGFNISEFLIKHAIMIIVASIVIISIVMLYFIYYFIKRIK